MAKSRREYTVSETRLLAEFLGATYPNRRTMQRVRVGRIPAELDIRGLTPPEIASLGIWRRWVDAVVWDPPSVILVEAGIRPDLGDVSKLEGYMRLFPETPEFLEFRTWQLHGQLVYCVDDPVVRAMARERGYTVRIFRPTWVEAYLAELAPRLRRSPLPSP